ncbi:MAG: Rieske 2Fe-2S domain-containing protein [Chloroflexi bacterium]|nr:Rieske 2Fe-2S domain-containing protein [Chloroflexota bacterium]
MLTQEANRRATEVGPGTPMGNLMRRYWHPIAASAELDDEPLRTKSVRLLGEDLTLFRTQRGGLGLVEKHCAHRRADLAYGIAEDDGLRCQYHGWKYSTTGQCIEAPFEDTMHPDGALKSTVKLTAYPVQELGGLIFAYLGPEPVPLVPRWSPLVAENAVRDIAISVLPCNWLQCQENSLDPVHVEWLHNHYGNYVRRLKAHENRQDNVGVRNVQNHRKIGFDLFEYGIIKRRVFAGFTEEDDDWKIGHPILFPNILLVGSEVSATLQFRVPVDDTHTLHISNYTFNARPGTQAPRQARVPYRHVPLYDERNRYIVDLTFNQDYSVWMSQGPIARRDLERLGESDKGVAMFRLLLEREMAAVARGEDPMNVFRDPETNECLEPPLEQTKFGHTERSARYFAAEAGVSSAVAEIEQTLGTWVTQAEPVRAR